MRFDFMILPQYTPFLKDRRQPGLLHLHDLDFSFRHGCDLNDEDEIISKASLARRRAVANDQAVRSMDLNDRGSRN